MQLINIRNLGLLLFSITLAACSSIQQMRTMDYRTGEATTLNLSLEQAKSRAEAAMQAGGFKESGREKHGNKFYLYGESAGEGSFEPGKRQYTTGQLLRIVLVAEEGKTQAYVMVQEKLGLNTGATQMSAKRVLNALSAG